MDVSEAIRAPVEPLPPLSCDGQFHTFGDPSRYPNRNPKGSYTVPLAPWERLLYTHEALGIHRGLIVQPTAYKTDHSCLVDSLAALPRDRYRGVALIDDGVADRQLRDLHDAGVRGVRFVFWQKLGVGPSLETFRRSLARVRAMGWFLKVIATPVELPALFEALAEIDDVPVVLDHMCRLQPLATPDDPAFAVVRDLLRRPNYWIMLSNGHRYSECRHRPEAVVALARRLYALAPDRALWGSDWPHLGRDSWSPDDAGMIELLYRFLPDAASRHAVLVDNPARLLGF